MHLAVEALAVSRNRRGMGRYARSLLAAMALERPGLRYSIFARNAADVAPLSEQLAALPGVMERATVHAASDMAQLHCDAAWYPCNFVTHRPRSGAIVPTVHDLFPMLQLDGRWWKVIKRARARHRYASTIASAHHLITGATNAAAEIVQQFGVAPDRISVVPHAADDFRRADPVLADTILARLRITGPFLLAVSSQEPRKNLGVLYAALPMLHAAGRRIPLVLCGPRGVHGYRSGDTLPPWLHLAGFVSDDELSALYSRALALVFPSKYEGFGLPVLEAMMVGGAVICADASTLPEVGGDAMLYFPPDDAQALVAQVTRLLDDATLRSALARAGALQAAKYSWARSARGTLAAIDRGIEVAARGASVGSQP